jgi:hypothetical protein
MGSGRTSGPVRRSGSVNASRFVALFVLSTASPADRLRHPSHGLALSPLPTSPAFGGPVFAPKTKKKGKKNVKKQKKNYMNGTKEKKSPHK